MDSIHFDPIPYATFDGRKFTDDAGFVIRKAKVFETGEWTDKGFALDDSEADDAVRAFAPVPNNIEHRPSVLDGHLGTTEGLYRKGKDLFASLRIPQWLDDLVGKEPIRLSAEWTKEPKRMTGMAMVLNPRIVTAAAHAFTQSPDFKTFAAEHPSEAAELVTEAAKAPAPRKPMNPQQIQDAAWTTFHADPANADVSREQFNAAFSTPQATPATTPDPVLNSLRADIDGIKATQNAQSAEFAKQQDERDALTFFRDLLKDEKGQSRVLVADEADILAQFRTARKADRATLTTFSANAEGSEEKALRERYAAKPVVFNWTGQLPSQSAPFTPAPEAGKYGALEAHFAAEEAAKKEDK